MNTDSKMNRKMISLVALVLTIGCSPLVTTAWGSIITIDSLTLVKQSDLFDLTAIGSLDWALPQRSEKAGGTAIVTYATLDGHPDGHLAATYGIYNEWMTAASYSYTNGEPGSSVGPQPGGITSVNELRDGSYFATINLPAGSGTVTAWASTWSYDDLRTYP